MNKRIRVAVTGAAGQIGYALLFRIASGQMFGPDTEIELNLLELEPSLPMLAGVAMELDDCAFPLLKRVICTADLKTCMDGVNWALLVGSVPRKQGMERADLLKINGSIFIEQGRAINAYAASDVQVFVVGNPCNTNCLITMHHAKDIPDNRFFSMMTLDELRSRNFLAQRANVPLTAITEMTVWGNHSATQYPDFYHAKINGISAAEVIADLPWLQETFIPTVQQRGAAVIKARGASSAASAANAIIQAVRHLTQDTPINETFSIALRSHGAYGVDDGLMFSFPCRREQGKIRVIEDLSLNVFSQEKLQITLNELRHERTVIADLLS